MKKYIILTIILCIGYSIHANVKTIREDRIWVYSTLSTATLEGGISKAKFDGKYTYNDKEYHRFALKQETTWISQYNSQTFVRPPETKQYDATLAFMREENGKIFILAKETPHSWFDVVTDVDSMNGAAELLVMDFNMKAGEKKVMTGTTGGML